jgi:hypothetical protein
LPKPVATSDLPKPVKMPSRFDCGFAAEIQSKKFEKGVAMGVGSEYRARPQIRGDLGFAGKNTHIHPEIINLRAWLKFD